jgi:hypothetical protein
VFEERALAAPLGWISFSARVVSVFTLNRSTVSADLLGIGFRPVTGPNPILGKGLE